MPLCCYERKGWNTGQNGEASPPAQQASGGREKNATPLCPPCPAAAISGSHIVTEQKFIEKR